MNNTPNKWEQSIIDNAVEYSIMEWRPLDKSTKLLLSLMARQKNYIKRPVRNIEQL